MPMARRRVHYRSRQRPSIAVRNEQDELSRGTQKRHALWLVRCGPRYDWSTSTPSPQTPASLAAARAPKPQGPATAKTTLEPAAIWSVSHCLALVLRDEVLRVA